MKALLTRLLVATLLISVVTALAWKLLMIESSSATSGGSAASSESDAGTPSASSQASTSRPATSTQAAAALQQMGEVSQRLMPEGFESLFIGMTLDALRQARTRVRHDTRGERADGLQIWDEDDPSGARVVYLVTTSNLLAQVQFLSRLESTEELGPHFAALQHRYGSPTGIWDCPESADSSPLRRFTWRREGASVMEAVMIYNQRVALTLVISPTDDVGAALRRSQCTPVQSPEQIARFPVVGELRGERSTFLRELPPRARDAGSAH
ncbi:MAG: hypothetical protein Q8Q09_09375 [Deltaproteobacteria bacterium]|nr:hypothetical protein [Deltaproteobacteria bacterium]